MSLTSKHMSSSEDLPRGIDDGGSQDSEAEVDESFVDLEEVASVKIYDSNQPHAIAES